MHQDVDALLPLGDLKMVHLHRRARVQDDWNHLIRVAFRRELHVHRRPWVLAALRKEHTCRMEPPALLADRRLAVCIVQRRDGLHYDVRRERRVFIINELLRHRRVLDAQLQEIGRVLNAALPCG